MYSDVFSNSRRIKGRRDELICCVIKGYFNLFVGRILGCNVLVFWFNLRYGGSLFLAKLELPMNIALNIMRIPGTSAVKNSY